VSREKDVVRGLRGLGLDSGDVVRVVTDGLRCLSGLWRIVATVQSVIYYTTFGVVGLVSWNLLGVVAIDE
jgi:hypothetical protein